MRMMSTRAAVAEAIELVRARFFVHIGAVDHPESLAVGVRGLRFNHPGGRGSW